MAYRDSSTYDHPLQPAFSQRDPASMARRLRSGRRRRSEPRHRDRRGPLGVHDLRASRAFTALRLIDVVTASHSHMNELATLEFGLQQLARLEDELAPDGAVPGPLMLALSSRTRIGTVERANAIAAATLPAEAQRRLTVMPIEITTGYRRPTANGRRAARSLGSCTSSTPASRLMSTLRIRMIGVSGLTSSSCRCATTGRPRASCRASA